ncbi:MAG TPA: hypothetical protein VE753_08675 [Gaiellaceae bacterium]|jgi:hypothetical protein|nr:hypothetical protein [Gaiellaceae bacterium]
MDDPTRARLVDDASLEGRGISTTLPRSDVERAIGSSEGPAQLTLDLRAGDEEHKLAIAWEREDLERIVGRTSGDSVVLTFDRDELAHAVAGDVEAHGLRERVAVVAVAAATATGAFAGAAAASPVGDPGPSGTAPTLSEHAQLPASDEGGISISAPDPATAAGIGAGIAIMIAGASFVAAGRQGRIARPA